uniref:Uncharacterized protein n=1 Tax=Aquila chrysaetos chrysaetos TaxID=223781 RepID=A0A663FD42_AQUCH
MAASTSRGREAPHLRARGHGVSHPPPNPVVIPPSSGTAASVCRYTSDTVAAAFIWGALCGGETGGGSRATLRMGDGCQNLQGMGDGSEATQSMGVGSQPTLGMGDESQTTLGTGNGSQATLRMGDGCQDLQEMGDGSQAPQGKGDGSQAPQGKGDGSQPPRPVPSPGLGATAPCKGTPGCSGRC